jgi:putative transposase
MVSFINEHRDKYGVEPICQQLQIAPSTFYDHQTKQQDPDKRSARAKRDEALCVDVKRVFDENYGVYGVKKVWRQMNREDIRVARCTVERLMKRLGLEGTRRGRRCRTTIPYTGLVRPADLVQRKFVAERPNQLWVADITYVATWSGFAYVAFVVDVFSRRIVGWRVSRTMRTDLVLDALEQASVGPWRGQGRDSPQRSVAVSTCRSATPSVWPRPVWNHRLAAAATPTTTPWQRRSTGYTRPS